jgi:oxygen-independent coproporphyrinogen-3 oxidase
VYVHFPWCLRKCLYCDFASQAQDRATIDHAGYADAILRELAARAPDFQGGPGPGAVIGSVFFGGGTPSLWAPPEIGRITASVRATFPCAPDLEVTVECNPTSLDANAALALRQAGVNRLSVGVQSLRPAYLELLGRLHDPEGARAAIHAALASGGLRVSADLIFGLPGQTADEACEEALALVAAGLRHLSCYQLTLEPSTPLFDRVRAGLIPRPDDATVAQTFGALDRTLRDAGLGHYEISNYSRPGEEARHNLGYWRGEEYLGLGCGAFGFARIPGAWPARGVRYRNPALPEAYVEATNSPAGVRATEAVEPLDHQTLMRERIMLGLRMKSGVDLDAAATDLGADGWTPGRKRAAERLIGRGRLVREGSRVVIPAAAWTWADDTTARLL